jgi:arsenate reductase
MAEGFGRSQFPDDMSAESAGIRPIGIDDRAIEVMEELDIDLRDLNSTSIRDVSDLPDLLVAMSHAVERKLPDRFQDIETVTWSITDPYHASGSREEQLERFRTVRDDIRAHVRHLINEI